MKIISLFFAYFICFCTHAQSSQYYWFDRKFNKTDSYAKARYQALVTSPNVPTKLRLVGSDALFAEGCIVPADTLQFEGLVLYYQPNNHVSEVQMIKNGTIQKPIFVNENLKPVLGESLYSLVLADNGTFYTVKTEIGMDLKPQKFLYAKGKIADNDVHKMDSSVTFFNKKGDIVDIKKYDKGKELPFINTTMCYDKPHDILGIVSHATNNFYNIDNEMQDFLLKCKVSGADGVIGVNISTSQIPSTDHSIARSTLIIQGTTIKFK